MARRRKKHEEHQNHEAWAIPYGDLITLLLAFFVVMYAISSVNEGKYRVLSDSLVAAFRGSPRTLEPVQVGEKQVGSGADVKTTLVEQSMLDGQPRSMLTPLPIDKAHPQTVSSKFPDAAAEGLEQVADKVARAMDSLVKADLVVVRRNRLWIEVEIRTDILFPSGSARLSTGAVQVIGQLADVLQPFPNAVRVEGHTDDRPINTAAFPSNWELSAARAASVVHLFAKRGVAPRRLAVIGLGEFRPVKGNTSVDGRNANRRVTIVILSAENSASADPAAPRAAPPPTLEPGELAQPAGSPSQDVNAAPTPTLPVAPRPERVPEQIAQTHGIDPAP